MNLRAAIYTAMGLISCAAAQNPAPPPATVSKPLMAVMPFDGKRVETAEVSIVADALANELLRSGHARVMERAQMDKILSEQGFQGSGACEQGECAVQVGKLLGIDRLVVGSVGKIGRTYVINARLVDVTTGEVQKSSSRSVQGEIDAVLTDLVPLVSADLLGIAPPPVVEQPAKDTTPVASHEAPAELPGPVLVPKWSWGVNLRLGVGGAAAGSKFQFDRNSTVGANTALGQFLDKAHEKPSPSVFGGLSAHILYSPLPWLGLGLGVGASRWQSDFKADSTTSSTQRASLTDNFRLQTADLRALVRWNFLKRYHLGAGYAIHYPIGGSVERTASTRNLLATESVGGTRDVVAAKESLSEEAFRKSIHVATFHAIQVETGVAVGKHWSVQLGMEPYTTPLLAAYTLKNGTRQKDGLRSSAQNIRLRNATLGVGWNW